MAVAISESFSSATVVCWKLNHIFPKCSPGKKNYYFISIWLLLFYCWFMTGVGPGFSLEIVLY